MLVDMINQPMTGSHASKSIRQVFTDATAPASLPRHLVTRVLKPSLTEHVRAFAIDPRRLEH